MPQKPALHMQSVSFLLPDGASVFAGQSRHSSLDVAPTVAEYMPVVQLTHNVSPCVTLYVPAAQSEQCPPPERVKPTLQVHAVEFELPTGEYVSAAQTPHVSLTVAPTRAECLPAAHFTQALLPDTTL